MYVIRKQMKFNFPISFDAAKAVLKFKASPTVQDWHVSKRSSNFLTIFLQWYIYVGPEITARSLFFSA